MEQDLTKPLELPTAYLRMWTIYERPSDYPDHYVVRGVTIRGGHVIHDHLARVITKTLNDARAAIPTECDTRIPRDPSDEPQIVETWL